MEIRDVLLLHEEFLSDFGFSLDAKTLHYTKEFAEGRQMIFFHYTQYDDVAYLEYHLGIRIHNVENIVHKFLPSLGDYRERSITLVETMDRIDMDMPRRFLIEDEMKVSDIISRVEEFFVKKGFDFLDRLSNVSTLERYFNHDTKCVILTQNFTYSSARGITLAKLFNESVYDEIKNEYLEMFSEKQETPFTLACFINLLAFLDHQLVSGV